jgi:hypothetical protein
MVLRRDAIGALHQGGFLDQGDDVTRARFLDGVVEPGQRANVNHGLIYRR